VYGHANILESGASGDFREAENSTHVKPFKPRAANRPRLSSRKCNPVTVHCNGEKCGVHHTLANKTNPACETPTAGSVLASQDNCRRTPGLWDAPVHQARFEPLFAQLKQVKPWLLNSAHRLVRVDISKLCRELPRVRFPQLSSTAIHTFNTILRLPPSGFASCNRNVARGLENPCTLLFPTMMQSPVAMKLVPFASKPPLTRRRGRHSPIAAEHLQFRPRATSSAIPKISGGGSKASTRLRTTRAAINEQFWPIWHHSIA